MSVRLLQNLRSNVSGRLSIKPFAAGLRASHCRTFDIKKLRFQAAAKALRDEGLSSGAVMTQEEIGRFSDTIKVIDIQQIRRI
jgi:hypothetical protein